MESTHPIRLTAEPDLRRSRLTVLFRLPLAVVHLIWLALWSVAIVVAALVGWVIALVRGQLPAALHSFIGAYVRYAIHVYAFLFLAGNPFPGFVGAEGSYPVDIHIDPPARQNRWKTGFRAILVIPASILAGALGGGVNFSSGRYGISFGLLLTCAVLGWFVALVRAQLPRGFHDSMAYALAYHAQTLGYFLLLTDRYPNSDPESLVEVAPPEGRWVALERQQDDGARSRLTVFFRIVLVLPHLVLLYLWSILVWILVLVDWFALLITGRAPEPFQRMVAGFVRYSLHVVAYFMLVTQRYPTFAAGGAQRYTLDVSFGPVEPQNRWKTLFRLFLALPSELLSGAYFSALITAAFLGWFAALVTGRMPTGLRKLGLASLWYITEAYAYILLLTDRYPQTSPVIPPLSAPSPAVEMPPSGGPPPVEPPPAAA